MKKAVISTGGKQYVVAEGETLDIELISEEKTVSFEPLLVVDGDKVSVGTPAVEGAKVSAQVVAQEVRDDKVIAIRYKPKKRVRTIRGHRQKHTQIKITKIA